MNRNYEVKPEEQTDVDLLLVCFSLRLGYVNLVRRLGKVRQGQDNIGSLCAKLFMITITES
jgi:hypothetical protein